MRPIIFCVFPLLISGCAENQLEIQSLIDKNTLMIDSIDIYKTLKNSESLNSKEIYFYLSTITSDSVELNKILDTTFSFKLKNEHSIYFIDRKWLDFSGVAQNVSVLVVWLEQDYSLREMDSFSNAILKDKTILVRKDTITIDTFYLNEGVVKRKFFADEILIDVNDSIVMNSHRLDFITPPTR